jgi:NAD(P)-dependent dehydrogenase (short-subunit alcohol dehydrogenase family)
MTSRRVLLIGGTGPVGQSSIGHLLEAGHTVALAHTGRHEARPDVEHLHGDRTTLLAPGGPVDRVARAVAGGLEYAPAGRFACNVGDPRDFTYGALAALRSCEA